VVFWSPLYGVAGDTDAGARVAVTAPPSLRPSKTREGSEGVIGAGASALAGVVAGLVSLPLSKRTGVCKRATGAGVLRSAALVQVRKSSNLGETAGGSAPTEAMASVNSTSNQQTTKSICRMASSPVWLNICSAVG